jgi:hypothetical protein
MRLLVHQNQRINILKFECNMLSNLALNLHKESLTAVSNNRAFDIYVQVEGKEKETIHQIREPMDIKQQNSSPSFSCYEEANNNKVFR